MITATQEAFCSQEVAKLLEEKGFIKDCTRIHTHCNPYDPYFIVDILITPNTPTHQTAMRWLREEKGIFLEIFCYARNDYAFSIEKFIEGTIDGFPLADEDASYNTYEEAVEAALRYTLENLI